MDAEKELDPILDFARRTCGTAEFHLVADKLQAIHNRLTGKSGEYALGVRIRTLIRPNDGCFGLIPPRPQTRLDMRLRVIRSEQLLLNAARRSVAIQHDEVSDERVRHPADIRWPGSGLAFSLAELAFGKQGNLLTEHETREARLYLGDQEVDEFFRQDWNFGKEFENFSLEVRLNLYLNLALKLPGALTHPAHLVERLKLHQRACLKELQRLVDEHQRHIHALETAASDADGQHLGREIIRLAKKIRDELGHATRLRLENRGLVRDLAKRFPQPQP